jgi:hypothetical protein
MVKAGDPGVLFAGCGETTTGEKGHVLRTTNFGESWEILPLPTQLPAGPAGVQPLQNARIGGYYAFVAAKLVVHLGNTGSAGPNRSRLGQETTIPDECVLAEGRKNRPQRRTKT